MMQAYQCTLVGNQIYGNYDGIYMDASTNCTISGNEVYLCAGSGIILSYGSDGNRMEYNNCSNNGEAGIELQDNIENTIVENEMKGNGEGLWINDSSRTVITENNISRNDDGMIVSGDSDGNLMLNNTISNNTEYGLRIEDPEAENNTIYGNNFTGNNGGGVQGYDGGNGTAWDDGEGAGNHWSDLPTRYPAASPNGTVWNVSYELDGPAGSYDAYPLLPIGYKLNETPDENETPEENETLPVLAIAGNSRTILEGEELIFDGTGSTGNGNITNYTWRFTYDGSEVVLYGPGPRFTFELPGTYRITLTVTDTLKLTDSTELIVTVLEREPEDQGAIATMEVRQGEIRVITYNHTDGGRTSVTIAGNGTLVASTLEDNTSEVEGEPEDLVRISYYLKLTFDGDLNWTNITIPFGEAGLNGSIDYAGAKIYYYDGSIWRQAENTGVDYEGRLVWANVTHFTIFAAYAPAKADDVGGDPGTEGGKDKESWYMSTSVIVAGVSIMIVLVLLGVFLYVRAGMGDEEDMDEGMEKGTDQGTDKGTNEAKKDLPAGENAGEEIGDRDAGKDAGTGKKSDGMEKTSSSEPDLIARVTMDGDSVEEDTKEKDAGAKPEEKREVEGDTEKKADGLLPPPGAPAILPPVAPPPLAPPTLTPLPPPGSGIKPPSDDDDGDMMELVPVLQPIGSSEPPVDTPPPPPM